MHYINWLGQKREKGQVFLITIFILGIVSIALVISLATNSVTHVVDLRSETAGSQASYIARAGIEEMLYRLGNDPNFGSGQPATVSGSIFGQGSYIATISGDAQTRTATATGTLGKNIRKISVSLSASASAGNVVLAYAAQIGQGGIEMSNGSQISGTGGSDGNVYSNGIIHGSNTASIKGNAWAVSGINPSGGSMTITKNAYGSVIRDCTVNGNTYSPALPTNCTVLGSKIITPAPTPISLPSVDIAYWQNAASAGGTISSYSKDSGTATLGPKKITGNVNISNSAIVTITGPLWVYGTFSISNSAKVKLDDAFGKDGTIILLDHPTDKANNGRLTISNSASVDKTSQGGYILFVSTLTRNDCSPAAATFSNQAANTAIVANDGCVQISNSGSLVALAARQLNLANGAQISYDLGLSSELYLPGPGVGGSGGNFGWSISSWQEVP